ncbi:unnamed protein product [Effrenium voratum]|uniref:Uncharacterized protein n=1 Tax=Effrenium voratum TaxID=2562239 RepID=A0AA36JS71_9DINO|nr:unnamed protein product [Effrenium voratum]
MGRFDLELLQQAAPFSAPRRMGLEVTSLPVGRCSSFLDIEAPLRRPLRSSFEEPPKEEGEEEEIPQPDPYPEQCKVELRPDEPRACEQRWVNWCQDECRAHYGVKPKRLYNGLDRAQCYLHLSLRHGPRRRWPRPTHVPLAERLLSTALADSELYTFPKDAEQEEMEED